MTKSRNYSVMAYSVPLTFNTMERSHIKEVVETNNLPKDSIKKCRWTKAPERRNPNQSVGHVIITFTDPDSVNQSILNGLVICNKKVSVTKCKQEPVRCLKCQGYNHVVNECIIRRDICAKCGENHRAAKCNSSILTCTPCGVQGHASNNQTCPTVLRKCADHKVKNPENLLPFFPSKEKWMWESTPPSSQRLAIPTDLASLVRPNRRGNMRQMQLSLQPRQTAPNGRELECLAWDRITEQGFIPANTMNQTTEQQTNNYGTSNE